MIVEKPREALKRNNYNTVSRHLPSITKNIIIQNEDICTISIRYTSNEYDTYFWVMLSKNAKNLFGKHTLMVHSKGYNYDSCHLS